MKRLSVLIIGRVDTTTAQYKKFADRFDCIHYDVTSLSQLLADFATKLAHIEAIFANWGGFAPIGGFRGKAITYAPPNLKVISMCQIGHDEFDIVAMRERGIALTNASLTVAFEAVADLVLYNAILSFRNFKFFEQAFSQNHSNTSDVRNLLIYGQFDADCGKPLLKHARYPVNFANAVCGRDNKSPRGHNAVIVGFGSIGKLIGERLSAIGMNIHYVKRTPLSVEELVNLGYQATYHETLLEAKAVADLIVVACPGTPQTKHLINKDIIDSMENPFRVINIGRGFVIDESALVDGLKSGKILFAGLDVFEEEPHINPDLIGRNDVVITPHIGSSISELYIEATLIAYNNIHTVLYETGERTNLVN